MKETDEIIRVQSGEKIEIFRRSFSSVPMNYQFAAKPIGSELLLGFLEIHTKQTVFSSPPKSIDLKPLNRVKAGIWDTFMTIYVVAGCDMEISLPKRDFKPVRPFLLLLIGVVFMAVLMLLMA